MLPAFNMRQLLEAGVHFGHQSHRWNPKMAPYIFGARNNIHIIDLAQTGAAAAPGAGQGARRGGRRRPRAVRRHQAPGVRRHRRGRQALGAVLHQSPLARRHADQLEDHLPVDPPPASSSRRLLAGEGKGRTKKEMLQLTRDRDKLNKSLGGIKEMGGLPDLLFVIDTNKEADRHRRSQEARHPDRRHRGHQLRSRRHRLPDSGQRRRRPRHHALLRSRGARGHRRHRARPGASRCRYRRLRGAADRGAARAGEKPCFKGIEAPRGEADDLKRLPSVNDKLEQRLNDAGVYHFWQIADLEPDMIEALDRALKLKGRIARDGWVAAAKKLSRGGRQPEGAVQCLPQGRATIAGPARHHRGLIR